MNPLGKKGPKNHPKRYHSGRGRSDLTGSFKGSSIMEERIHANCDSQPASFLEYSVAAILYRCGLQLDFIDRIL